MVGRIEVAKGDRSLRGNGGEQRRSRCSRLTVEGGHWMRALRKSTPQLHASRVRAGMWSRRNTDTFCSGEASGRLPIGRLKREAARACRSTRTGHLRAYGAGHRKSADGLSVSSLPLFPWAPVGFEEWHNGAALASSPMTKTHLLGFFFFGASRRI